MNKIDFSKNGGFPLTQYSLDFMQKAYKEAFAALAGLIGDKVIVQGMTEAGGAVADGWLSYQGELIQFSGGPIGDLSTASIIITETKAARLFLDGSTNDVYVTRTASIGVGGAFLYSELKRINTLQATFQSLADLITAFNIHTHNYADIAGKPLYYISHKGSFNIGDINPADMTLTVAIPNQGATDYIVTGSLVGNDNNWNSNNDVLLPLVYDKQVDSFKVGLREIGAVAQNIRFEFVIIKLY
jgi:hypothetical protein